MQNRAAWFGWVLVAVLAVATATAWALEIGDKAPALDVSAWAQGEPITIEGGAGKNVFVVEFVSTFKPDCQKALAAASKLQDKYRAKGLEVVAVSSESVDEVKKYLADNKASFRFAIDENHNAIAEFVGEDPNLPYAVVVDKAGIVVFAGDPAEGMDKLVDDVMAGKFDPKKAVELRKLRQELYEAWNTHEFDAADTICDKILTLDVTDSFAFRRRCDGFHRRENLDGYRKFVKSYADRAKDDAATQSRIASRLIDDGRFNWRDPELALVCAKRAVDLTKSTDADVIDTYARVLAELGLLEQAITEAKKAVAIAADNAQAKSRLAFLESCLALRQKAQPPTAGPKKK